MAAEQQLVSPGQAVRATMDTDSELGLFQDFRVVEGRLAHDTLDSTVNLHYNRQRSQFEPRTSVNNLELIVDAYLGVNPVAEFNARSCTLDEVQEQARRADAMYRTQVQASSWRGFLDRDMPKLVETIGPFLDLIPNEYGASILKGALGLIFNAISKTAENKEAILRFFHQVPGIIRDAREDQGILKKHPRVIEAADSLFRSVTEALGTLLGILLPKPKRANPGFLDKIMKRGGNDGKRLVDAIFRSESTANQIELALQAVVEAKTALDASIRQANSQTLEATQRISADTNRKADGTRAAVFDTKWAVDALGHQLDRRFADLQNTYRAENEHQTKTLLDGLAAAFHSGIYMLSHEARSNVHMTLICIPGTGLGGDSRPLTPLPPQQPPILLSAPQMDPAELLIWLGVHNNMPGADVQMVLSRQHEFHAAQLSRAERLLRNVSFARWLSGPESSFLLVEAHSDLHGTRRVTPISVFCAVLCRTLPILAAERSVPSIILHHFAGLHCTPGDSQWSGPGFMLRALILQLLLLWPREESDLGSNLSILREVPRLATGVQNHVSEALLHLLKHLILRLGPRVEIYIVVEDIARFEPLSCGSWRAELVAFVQNLQQLVAHLNGSGGPTLKVLLTAAERSAEVVRHLAPGEHVSLRGEQGIGGGGAFTQRGFARGLSELQTPPRAQADPGNPWTTPPGT